MMEMRIAVVRAALLYVDEQADHQFRLSETSRAAPMLGKVLRGCNLVLRDVAIRAGDEAPRSDDGRAPNRRWREPNPLDEAFATADAAALEP